jgi:Uncharacterized conserved protein
MSKELSHHHPFLAGCLILFPAVVTLFTLHLIFKWTLSPLFFLIAAVLPSSLSLWVTYPIALLVSALLVIALTCGIGFFVSNIVGFWFVSKMQKLLRKLPFVRSIYTACHDVVETLVADRDHRFSQVVLVPFPDDHGLVIGLIPKLIEHQFDGVQRIGVFVPGTPNPLMGFFLFFPEDTIKPTTISIEEALKLVISAGSLTPYSWNSTNRF